MATHSNRSPSPLSSRPLNPNPRNPETNPTIRRSFSGNRPSLLTNQRRFDPFTPANSPSDFGGRRSVGKSWEEKENDEKDCILKGSKLQSPAKGCKNFMAPTISAASKFTPSPRKKVLVERNEPIRTSISLTNGKALFFSNENEKFSDSNLAGSENKKAAVVESHKPVSKPCKKVSFAEIPSDSQHSAESVITDSDGLNVESKVVQTPITPLDADPSLPPYDPTTNYLSPRPQFIRYKPNPIVEMLLNKETELDSDEVEYSLMAEMMMSEGFSDSCEASADMVIGMDEEIEAVDHVSEQPSLALPVSTAAAEEMLVEEFVGSDGKKPRRVARLMCFSMVLVLLVAACVSVSMTHAPLFDESLFKNDLSLSDLYEQSRAVVASARVSLSRVAASSVALLFELVEGEKQAPVQVQFMNLSSLQENAWKEAYFLKRVESIEEEEEEEFEEELDTETEEADEEFDWELDLEDEIDAVEEEEQYAEADDYIEEVVNQDTAPDSVIQSAMDQENSPDSVIQSAMNQDTEVIQSSMNQEIAPDSVIQSAMNVETEVEAATEVAIDQSTAAHQNEKSEAEVAMETEKSQGDISVGSSDNADTESTGSVMAVGISCFVAGVIGVAALVYKMIPRSSSKVSRSSKTKAMEEEKEGCSQSWEMSSSFYPRSGGGNEVESSERKARKYSKLASSSGSPSYGSFTTYERIPIKTNGGGDEEIMTPVRRSSRIRKQVTRST
ncbi:hypothetical protein SASPL_118489 [Salvia splendens]|uniref:Uncharacterized protein n=1 Tax=Salvia splendens TaxID=180675 RepID=A0A8X8XZT7_SALSN|nr:uncharacterized protein LOC121810073 [Salvia splendens]KAG6421929.1 hypothetical protein SASPL_118489 [Salvia splendens]